MSYTEVMATSKTPSRAAKVWKKYELGIPTLVLALGIFLGVTLFLNGKPDQIESFVLNQNYLVEATWQHFLLSISAATIAALIAIPVGILLTRVHSKVINNFVMGLANIGQATPALGVLILLALLIGIGPSTAIIALVLYSLLPILRNTVVGIEGVDRSLTQAAKGMGMSSWQTLTKVELPIAIPVIIAGFRTALIFSVGVATLATFINSGGLGEAIVVGVKLNRPAVLLAGAILVSCMALLLDWAIGRLEQQLGPKGLN